MNVMSDTSDTSTPTDTMAEEFCLGLGEATGSNFGFDYFERNSIEYRERGG